MTFEADTKLDEDALETRSAIGVELPRVRRNEGQTAQIENSEKLAPAGSTSHRSLVTTYVARDRVDSAQALNCLTSRMPIVGTQRVGSVRTNMCVDVSTTSLVRRCKSIQHGSVCQTR